MKSIRPNSRAEAQYLRSVPRNNLSFLDLDDHCRMRVRMPAVDDRDFWAAHTTGTTMALELIRALRADRRGVSLWLILKTLEPHWKNTTMRNAFFEMLDLAITESVPLEVLADEHDRRLRRSFNAPVQVAA